MSKQFPSSHREAVKNSNHLYGLVIRKRIQTTIGLTLLPPPQHKEDHAVILKCSAIQLFYEPALRTPVLTRLYVRTKLWTVGSKCRTHYHMG